MEIIIQDTESIRQAARQFIAGMGEGRVFAFYGKMGAGKTTFIKALCEELGVDDVVTSPTFAIVNEYTMSNVQSSMSNVQCSMFNVQYPMSTVYHFDFYRIRSIGEVYDMGYEDYFYSGALCFIEWPELVEELLPPDAVRVSIEELGDGRRRVSIL